MLPCSQLSPVRDLPLKDWPALSGAELTETALSRSLAQLAVDGGPVQERAACECLRVGVGGLRCGLTVLTEVQQKRQGLRICGC